MVENARPLDSDVLMTVSKTGFSIEIVSGFLSSYALAYIRLNQESLMLAGLGFMRV